MSFDPEIFDAARQEFLSHLRYAKGHRPTTCYAYNSDLGLWADWLSAPARTGSGRGPATWSSGPPGSLRERQVSAHIVTRRLSCLSSFYKWALKHEIVDSDRSTWPTSPSGPSDPGVAEKEEQQRLEATIKDRRNIPINIFGTISPG